MHLVRLGKTNLRVSSIALGTGALGSRIDDHTSIRILDCFAGEGGVLIDTANVYGRWNPGNEPLSELLIGRWMRFHHLRDRFVLATKGAADDQRAIGVRRLSPTSIRSDLENSLQNLQTDHIDLYYLHQDDPAKPVGEIVETMNQLKGEGKIRYFGCSNWSRERITAADRYADEHGLESFCANEVMFNLAVPNRETVEAATQRSVDDGLYRYHQETRMPLVSYTSQAAGYFALYRRPDFMTAAKYAFSRDFFHNDRTLKHAERVELLCALRGYTPLQVTLGYLNAQSFQVIPIVGPWNEDEFMASIEASDAVLTREELSFVLDGEAL